ncbi:hypothetical protein ACJX0J_019121, partial [Zea mays]
MGSIFFYIRGRCKMMLSYNMYQIDYRRLNQIIFCLYYYPSLPFYRKHLWLFVRDKSLSTQGFVFLRVYKSLANATVEELGIFFTKTERVASKLLPAKKVPSSDQIADDFTKNVIVFYLIFKAARERERERLMLFEYVIC